MLVQVESYRQRFNWLWKGLHFGKGDSSASFPFLKVIRHFRSLAAKMGPKGTWRHQRITETADFDFLKNTEASNIKIYCNIVAHSPWRFSHLDWKWHQQLLLVHWNHVNMCVHRFHNFCVIAQSIWEMMTVVEMAFDVLHFLLCKVLRHFVCSLVSKIWPNVAGVAGSVTGVYIWHFASYKQM